MSAPTMTAEPTRLRSLDAYRGFVMLMMASAGFGFVKLAKDDPFDNWWLDNIAHQFDHVPWRGCSFWDLIQPSFMFIVGVAMPFSYANRRAQGQPWARQMGHALHRAAILVLLGVFLASAGQPRTHYVFTNVLAQIGLGYPVVFLLLAGRPWMQWLGVLVILAGDWLLFATHPLPGRDFAWAEVEIYPGWVGLRGFAEHWEKHVNFAADFDRWFLNLFPQASGRPFRFNPGGYTTLNFIPSIATMLLGVLAGGWLRSDRSDKEKSLILLLAGAVGIVVGTALDPQICPIVKRIWTPSWVVYSAGWACLLLTAFYWIIDVRGYRLWAFPMVVVGVNSIAMYLMAQLSKGWVRQTLQTHFGQQTLTHPVAESVAVLFALWLACFWLYRRRIFVKI